MTFTRHKVLRGTCRTDPAAPRHAHNSPPKLRKHCRGDHCWFRQSSTPVRRGREFLSARSRAVELNGASPCSTSGVSRVDEAHTGIPAIDLHPSRVPRHVAIIMDGNGRWAESRRLPSAAGHKKGVGALRQAVVCCRRWGVRALTVFAFSTENWTRGAQETSFLLALIEQTLNAELKELDRNGVRLRFIGAQESFSGSLRETMAQAERTTEGNEDLILTVALGYGGRQDIANAARTIAALVEQGKLKAENVSEDVVREALSGQASFGGVGDPDLLIRTSGEMRLSNFLLWDLAYTELYFSQEFWPDFGPEEFKSAIHEYAKRHRRYGRRL